MTKVTELVGTYTIDPAHSRIGFVARHAMVTKVRGSFEEFEGTATTGENLTDARIDLTIQVSSVHTRQADRDAHLRSSDFFDVAANPTITFTSTDVTAAGDDALRVIGDLSMKGVTKSVSIDFEYAGSAQDPSGNVRIGFEGSTKVNRKDYGLSWNAALETGGLLVSEQVTLEFEISAIKG